MRGEGGEGRRWEGKEKGGREGKGKGREGGEGREEGEGREGGEGEGGGREEVGISNRVHSCREGDISSHSSLYTIVPTKILFPKMGSS